MASPRSEARPRRTWPRRLLIGINLFLALCLVVTTAAYAYFRWRFEQIDKVELGEVLRGGGDDDPGEPMNVLLVGSDSRRDLSPEEQRGFGSEQEVAGQRSDTIMVLHVDPRAEKAAILSVPRDLWVPIAGMRGRDRINTAFDGGPDRLIQTMNEALGVEVDHFVQVDFNGFQGIVDAVGGVNVYFAAPARDRLSGLDIPQAGCIRLDGDQALAYVRSRHYQEREAGRWRGDGTGDLGRIQRQQDFVRRMMKKAISQGIRNPVKLNALLATAIENVTIDDAMSAKDVMRLGRRFRSLEPSAVDMLTLPTEAAKIRGADVLVLNQPDARALLDRFNGVAPEPGQQPEVPEVLPNTVRVRVLNGSGVGGQAGQLAVTLQKAGFNIAGTGDADSFRHVGTVIHYGSGQRAKAVALQARLAAGAELRPDPTLRGVDLVLVTGRDFRGVQGTEAPPPTEATTSTTVAEPGLPSPEAQARSQC